MIWLGRFSYVKPPITRAAFAGASCLICACKPCQAPLNSADWRSCFWFSAWRFTTTKCASVLATVPTYSWTSVACGSGNALNSCTGWWNWRTKRVTYVDACWLPSPSLVAYNQIMRVAAVIIALYINKDSCAICCSDVSRKKTCSGNLSCNNSRSPSCNNAFVRVVAGKLTLVAPNTITVWYPWRCTIPLSDTRTWSIVAGIPVYLALSNAAWSSSCNVSTVISVWSNTATKSSSTPINVRQTCSGCWAAHRSPASIAASRQAIKRCWMPICVKKPYSSRAISRASLASARRDKNGATTWLIWLWINANWASLAATCSRTTSSSESATLRSNCHGVSSVQRHPGKFLANA